MPKKTAARTCATILALFTVTVMLAGIASAQFTQSNHVSFTLEGCRNNGSITLPASSGTYSGEFVCPDAAYTTGNLGKGWNELDLVPHRLTTSAGNQSGVTTDYSVMVAADNVTGGVTGYDHIVFFPYAVNASLSDSSCALTAIGPEAYDGTAASPFGGGTDTAIYRQLNIHQNAGTTCVFDYVERLAIGSHNYPGSSLQSYIFEDAGFSVGKKTVSIQVNQITPQSLNKTMGAVENADHIWDISKNATPASFTFPNTCDATLPLATSSFPITITWTKEAATLGAITVTTHVYATNPSARQITVTVTDVVYSGTTPLDTATSSVVMDPNTANILVLTHTLTVPAGTPNLNDIATGTYTDTATGLPIPQTTTATASATVQTTEFNASATITDVESLGNPFLFSVDSTSGASGAFTGYPTLGVPILGPLTWTSVTQSDSGQVIFNKTIYATQFSQGSAQLKDTATLLGSDNFTTQAKLTSSISVSAEALVNLTITKNVTNGPLPAGSLAQTFTFHVFNSANQEVATPPITLNGGDTSKSTQLTGLIADTYTVIEGDPPANWTRGTVACGAGITCTPVTNGVSIPLIGANAASCANSVTFNNAFVPQDLTVGKTATPTFDRTFQWSIAKDVDKTKVTTNAGGTVTFTYTVNVSHDSGTDSNFAASGTITVTNPNFYPVTGDIADPGCTVTGGTGVSVDANGSANVAYSCSYGSSHPSSNTASVAWASGTASSTVPLDFTTPTTIKDGSVTVTDTLGGVLGSVSYTDPSPKTFTYSHDVTAPSGTCTTVDNTATFTTNTSGTTGSASQSVQVCGGLDLTVSKTANPTFTRTFHWNISKDVDNTRIDIAQGGSATFNYTVGVTHDNGTDSAWQVAGTITVSNPNNFEDIVVNVTDVVDNGGSCTVTGGSNVTVPKSSSVQLPYTCTYASAPSPASGTNTATATWDSNTYYTPHSSAAGSAGFAFTTPTTIVDGSVTVTDTLGGTLGTVSYTDPSPKTFTYSHTFSGDPAGTCTQHNNTATFTTNTTGTTGSASQTVTVCVGESLTVGKTANPSFSRQYFWQIAKQVSPLFVTAPEGTPETFSYTVGVQETSFTDSAWVLTGTISVSNPNDFEDITVNITDAVNNGGSCSVTNGTGVVVPKGGAFVSRDYTCTWGAAPSNASGTNTATLSVTSGTTPQSTYGVQVSFSFTTPTSTTNQTITVTDSYAGVLGTVTSPVTPPPLATQTFAYTRTITVGSTCTVYPNTATIVETGATATASVDVCPTPKVIKTVQGQPPTGTQAFTFQLRQGADTTHVGTILESQIANAANGGNITFNTNLIPGGTYQMCEIVMPGWSTTLGTFVPNSFIPPDGVAPNPNVDNSILCVNFTAGDPATLVFTIDNTPPPGGRALTIGFWKNWASCTTSSTNKKPVLDQTLALFEPTGLVVSATSGTFAVFGPTYYLQLHGSTTTPNVAPSCKAAVNLLNKSTITKGTKKASDPAFNLAAQLIGAELNYEAGAGRTPTATTAINASVLLLGKYHFNGNTHTTISAADAANMNTLANTLNNYNNDIP